MKNGEKVTINLPQRLVTTVDLARVMRELKMLDDWLNQAALRETGKPVSPPKTSATLEDVAMTNDISLLESTDRQKLLVLLKVFSDHAPKIHMSFAVEPSAAFLQRMISWLRTNINPLILLDVGLQPTLAAGCTVRTTNKLFDLSLRHRFVDSRPLLVESIAKFQNEPLHLTDETSPSPEVIVSTQPASAEVPQAPQSTQQTTPETKSQPQTQDAATPIATPATNPAVTEASVPSSQASPKTQGAAK